MNDYVILFDENGQPYISHSVWSKAKSAVNSGRKKATKYIEKIGEGAKARYFYTKEELDAYYNKGKKKANEAVNKAKQKAKDWSGVTAKKEYQSAVKRFNDASRNKKNVEKELSKSAYDRSLAKSEYGLSKSVADARKKVYDVEKDDFINKAERFLTGKNNKYEQKVYDEWVEAHGEAADKAVALNKANRNLYSDLSSAAKAGIEYNKAYNEVEKAKEKYKNTPLSKIEDFVSRSGLGDVVDAAKNKARDLKEDASEAVDKVKEARKAVNAYASDKLGDIKDWASDRAETAKEKFSGAKEKAKELAGSAKEKAAKAANAVKGAAASASDKVEDAASSVKSSYDKMKGEFHDKKVEKEVKKSTDSYKKWKEENKRPDDNIFTVSKATGETIRKNEMYDFYMEQIDNIYSEINARPHMSDSERKRQLQYVQTLMKNAEEYSEHK